MSIAETRRAFLGQGSLAIGAMALDSLLRGDSGINAVRADDVRNSGDAGVLSTSGTASSGAVQPLHFPPRAKRIIFLFQSGGPSQLDLFDPKPKLNELSGMPMPESLTRGQRVAQLQGQPLVCVGSKYRFQRRGNAGLEISELLPWTSEILDEITVIRSLQTDAINHDPAVTFMQTGSPQPGRPTMGAWLSYGLGSENRNLPAFVVLVSGIGQGQNLHTRYWGSGFLPSVHQGVQFRNQFDPILYLSNPPGVDAEARRVVLDGMRELNQRRFERTGDPEIAARIEQYEMAYRMQMSVPELIDISNERESVLDWYGEDVRQSGSFARNCLIARRLAQRGVRFIQLYHRDWDQHNNLPAELERQCRQSDRGGYALIKDLRAHGLLDDTIVVWSGEFGRTPMAQGSSNRDNYGRDHHMKAFSGWVAGGGFAAGRVIGKTDDFGYDILEQPCHVHDLHATILRLLGVDHLRLTYRFQGRDFRLTDIHGRLLSELLA